MRIKEDRQQSVKHDHNPDHLPNDVIDLGALFFALIERKLLIASITTVFALVGIVASLFSVPIYNATAMIQIEKSGSTMGGLDDMAGAFDSSSQSITEIELLKSRSVIGEAVDALGLDIVATPKLYPYIGELSFRRFNPAADDDVAEPRFGASSYAWGGEKIEVLRFDVPQHAINKVYILQASDNQRFTLLNAQGEVVLQGGVGEELTGNGVTLTIKTLVARAGVEFILSRKSRLTTILNLQTSIGASEKGNDSGIINLSFQHSNPDYSRKVLNAIARIYVTSNIERNSAEVTKSLEFLKVQLPQIKEELEASELLLNEYKTSSKSVNISIETSSVLTQMVELEAKLQELELLRLTMSLDFKANHPNYQGLLKRIDIIQKQRDALALKIEVLPETQQALLRLIRDVEIGNQIYTMVLSKVQELDIVRAGTIGNVRIIDVAEVTSSPVKPNKQLIVIFATLLGGMLAVAIVLIQNALNKAIESPRAIEAIGMPVYASIPYSDNQHKITAKINGKDTQSNNKLLASVNPADLTVEALRGLRTSLHFAMIEAEDNLLIFSGPSPALGKSFISANLGVVLAQSGKSVLLIDGDMRKGNLHTLFGLKPENGLSEYLSQQIAIEQVTKATAVANFDVISRGKIPPNPSELLMHKNFSQLLEVMREKYDIVIIDTPPILAVTDASIIAGAGGTLLLVTRYGVNTIKEIAYTRQQFEQNGIDIKGVVFNCVLKKARSAYRSYGYYNYSYQSGKD
jgi:tyrosine-protein kinase Etk/Wzc